MDYYPFIQQGPCKQIRKVKMLLVYVQVRLTKVILTQMKKEGRVDDAFFFVINIQVSPATIFCTSLRPYCDTWFYAFLFACGIFDGADVISQL